MMKIVDNGNKKKGNSKSLIVGVCAGLLCLIAVIVVVVLLSKKGDDAVEAGGTQVMEETSVDDNSLSNTEVESTSTPESEQETETKVEENAELQQVANYTSIKADEQSLIQLVKDTINSANADLQEASKENDALHSVLDTLKGVGATQHDQLDVNFMELVPAEVTLNVDESLSALNVAGSIGRSLFEQYEDFWPEGYTDGENLLAHFVGYGIYGVNVDGVSDWSVQADNIYKFVDDDVEFEVNFDVLFTANGTKWMALIGNVDGEYRVLDVINANKDQSLLKLIENPAELTVPEPAPEPEPEQSGNNGGANGGNGNENAGNGDNVGNVNPNPNAGQPGYEGEKEGFIWIPGVGYVTTTPGEGDQNGGGCQGSAPSEDEVLQSEKIGYM